MRLLVDMNLSPRWVEFFSKVGIEARHWSVCGSPNAPDAEIMIYAKQHAYIVMTYDLDFSAILASTQDSLPSVVQLRADNLSPEANGAQLVQALMQMQTDLAEGALLTFETTRTRVRLLPLRGR